MNKTLAVLILLAAAIGTTAAEPAPTSARWLQQYGALTTWGEDSGWSLGQFGLTIRTLNYFDGTKPDGFYYSIVSGAIVHPVDSFSFADLRVAGFGWRGNPVAALGGSSPMDFSLDLGLAPTVELRLRQNQLALDSASLAVGATVGLYLPFGDFGDLGISWEPVVDLAILQWGNTGVRNSTYSDFVVYWVVKTATETHHRPWVDPNGDR